MSPTRRRRQRSSEKPWRTLMVWSSRSTETKIWHKVRRFHPSPTRPDLSLPSSGSQSRVTTPLCSPREGQWEQPQAHVEMAGWGEELVWHFPPTPGSFLGVWDQWRLPPSLLYRNCHGTFCEEGRGSPLRSLWPLHSHAVWDHSEAPQDHGSQPEPQGEWPPVPSHHSVG